MAYSTVVTHSTGGYSHRKRTHSWASGSAISSPTSTGSSAS